MSRFFSDPNIANMDEDTLIVLVVEDWSNMPKVSELNEAYRKVETALEDEGYDEGFEQRIFIVDPNTDGSFDDCQKEYLKYDYYLETCQGDRDARFNHMLLHILSWAYVSTDSSCTGIPERANLVILSRNENLGKGTKFSQVLDTLSKDGFNVTIVNPDNFPEVDD